MRPLDDTRDIGHDERLVVPHLDNAQIGFERSEGVVGNLGFGGRHHRQQRTLSGIREPDKAHVGQHLQFEDKGTLVTLFARLGVTRRLIRRALEVPVAQTSTAALEQNQTLAILGHLTDILVRDRTILMLHDTARNRTQRHRNDYIACILSRRACAVAAFAILGKLVTLVFEVYERPILAVALKHYAAALAAVAAVGAAEGDELLTPEVARAGPAVARTGKYLHVIDKIRSCHNLVFNRIPTVHLHATIGPQR